MKFNFETDYIYIFHSEPLIKYNNLFSIDFNKDLFWKSNEIEEGSAFNLGNYKDWKDKKDLLEENIITLK